MIKNLELIKKMTLEEKASLLSGENFWNTKAIERLGIPSIMLTDGPHGLRKQGGKADHLGLNKSIPATCFPTAATLANSWDVELLSAVGEKLADECLKEEVSVILGPGLNIKRNPLCGRNFEYFSEDPYLTGKLAASMIQGIESKGVSACPKHYAVNSQEHMRMTIDERVDERALREMYLEGFRYAVTEGKPGTLMTSYNQVNGTFANEHPHLLREILLDEWEFEGVVVTDWGGNNDRLAGLIAGNHLEMPATGGITDREIVKAVKEKKLDERLLDERVDTLLSLIFKQANNTIDHNYSIKNANTDKDESISNHLENQNAIPIDYKLQHAFAVETAKQCMVLLKNEEDVLPLNRTQKLAVIGDFAKKPRYQGAGSSLIEPTELDNALDQIRNRTPNVIGYAQGFNRLGGASQKLIDEAVALAKSSEVALVFLGLDEGSEAEGVDRKDMALRSEQLDLMLALLRAQDGEKYKIVIVLSGGSPVEIPFEGNVQGILHSYLGGQGSGEATAALLFGELSPSGKLAETYPVAYKDVPSSAYYPGIEKTSEHREGLYFGYRYYDKTKVRVRYPFGYGLSYTSFKYSELVIDGDQVSFKVTNIGNMAASEIVQLYIGKEQENVYRCEKELKGFGKQFIESGATHVFTLQLEPHHFEYFDVFTDQWETESGKYEIAIGASSEDIRLKGYIEITTEKVADHPFVASPKCVSVAHVSLSQDRLLAPYYTGAIKSVSSEAFEKLCGAELPKNTWNRQSPLGLNDTVGQGHYKSWVGRTLAGVLNLARKVLWKTGHPILANNVYFVINMPFRQIERFTKGKFSKRNVHRLLNVTNYGLIKGLMHRIDDN